MSTTFDPLQFKSMLWDLLVRLFGTDLQTTESIDLKITIGIGIFAIIFVGKILNHLIGGNDRGFIITGLGLLLPAFIILSGYVLVHMYFGTAITNPKALEYAGWAAGGLGGLIVLLFITPFFLATGIIKTHIIFILTSVISYFGMHYGQNIVKAFDKGVSTFNNASSYSKDIPDEFKNEEKFSDILKRILKGEKKPDSASPKE